MPKILLIDDDHELVDIIHYALRRAGFEVLVAYGAPMALKHFERNSPDLAVLDITLGATSGFDLLKTIRQKSSIPVIILSAQDREQDKVRGLDLGADDFMSKPFSHSEFLARIRASLRRAACEPSQGEATNGRGATNGQLHLGPLVLTPAEHSVQKDGRPLSLSANEYRLLHYLMLNARAVLPAQALAKHVWGYDNLSTTEIVRVAVYRLRRKLEDDPAHPKLLHTIPGVGFILKPLTALIPLVMALSEDLPSLLDPLGEMIPLLAPLTASFS